MCHTLVRAAKSVGNITYPLDSASDVIRNGCVFSIGEFVVV